MKKTRTFQQWIMGLILVTTLGATTLQADESTLSMANDYWAVLGGYGMAIPGWGKTSERVKTVDAVLRYSHILNKDRGRSWYQGNHEFWVECPIAFVVDPATSPIFAMNFMVSWVFTSSPIVQPYVMAGGGPVYAEADIPGMGSRLCGNYQAGGGLRIHLSDRIAFNAELRYHHISNLGMADPNVPLNSVKAFSGLTFAF